MRVRTFDKRWLFYGYASHNTARADSLRVFQLLARFFPVGARALLRECMKWRLNPKKLTAEVIGQMEDRVAALLTAAFSVAASDVGVQITPYVKVSLNMSSLFAKQRRPVFTVTVADSELRHVFLQGNLPSGAYWQDRRINNLYQLRRLTGDLVTVLRDHIGRAYRVGAVGADKAAFEWLLGDDTGRSSVFLLAHMIGVTKESIDIPHDLWDVGRCVRLLQRFPEWRARLDEMAKYGIEWATYVSVWDTLEALVQLHSSHRYDQDVARRCECGQNAKAVLAAARERQFAIAAERARMVA